jgi:hypothetical protein
MNGIELQRSKKMSDNNQNEDGSFNEDELQDIMSEIENLEKDFVEEQLANPADVTPKTSKDQVEVEAAIEIQDDLQSSIDAEIAELNAITEVAQPESVDVEQETQTEIIEETIDNNVVNLVQPEPIEEISKHQATYSGSPVEVSCNGEMNFAMNFSLGETSANVKVDNETGLSVEMDGVSLSISEEKGCIISLPGGIKFTVPLTSEGASATKKAS